VSGSEGSTVSQMNLRALAYYIIPITLALALLDKYFLGKTYIFSPERLQVICQSSISKYGNDTEALMKDIVASLQTEYGQAILPYEGNKWVLNNAGGAMVFNPFSVELKA
jgi:ERG2 and Sigma1 receptor like protein